MKLIISILLFAALSMPSGASVINSWNPAVVDNVYVNDTVSRTIEYSITTAGQMKANHWSVDGVPVVGSENNGTYSYSHTWDSKRIGSHTVIYKGNSAGAQVEFRWYVNVYEMGGLGGGNIFDIIDDTLSNKVAEIKIRMFRYRMEKQEDKAKIASQKVEGLKEEIAGSLNTRESLLEEFKAGNITIEKYASSMKQVERDSKYRKKQAKELARISKEELKDENFSKDFEKISEMEDDHGREHAKYKERDDNTEDGDDWRGKENKNKEKSDEHKED